MAEERKGPRRLSLQLSEHEEQIIIDLKIKLLREGRTLKKFVLDALAAKLADEAKKK